MRFTIARLMMLIGACGLLFATIRFVPYVLWLVVPVLAFHWERRRGRNGIRGAALACGIFCAVPVAVVSAWRTLTGAPTGPTLIGPLTEVSIFWFTGCAVGTAIGIGCWGLDWLDARGHYYTDAGPAVISAATAPGTVGVVSVRGGSEQIGTAQTIGALADGLAVYRLTVRGVELRGRWICADGRTFTPAEGRGVALVEEPNVSKEGHTVERS